MGNGPYISLDLEKDTSEDAIKLQHSQYAQPKTSYSSLNLL